MWCVTMLYKYTFICGSSFCPYHLIVMNFKYWLLFLLLLEIYIFCRLRLKPKSSARFEYHKQTHTHTLPRTHCKSNGTDFCRTTENLIFAHAISITCVYHVSILLSQFSEVHTRTLHSERYLYICAHSDYRIRTESNRPFYMFMFIWEAFGCVFLQSRKLSILVLGPNGFILQCVAV